MELIIYIKMDLALNNLQRLICHKTKQNQIYPYLLWKSWLIFLGEMAAHILHIQSIFQKEIWLLSTEKYMNGGLVKSRGTNADMQILSLTQ